MVQEMSPVRRQLGALGKTARRKRIFARLREGASYEEIAGEESVSRERVRQIVSEVLQKKGGRQRRRSCEAAIGSSRAPDAACGRSRRRRRRQRHYALFEGARSAPPLPDWRPRAPTL